MAAAARAEGVLPSHQSARWPRGNAPRSLPDGLPASPPPSYRAGIVAEQHCGSDTGLLAHRVVAATAHDHFLNLSVRVAVLDGEARGVGTQLAVLGVRDL